MIYVLGYNDPIPEGAVVFNTTSRSTDFAKGLSPMIVGPVSINGHISYNVENAWQYSKVYHPHVDENDDPTEEYFEWRNKGYATVWGQRYPMGKGAKALYSLIGIEKLDYITARKRVYIPLYRDAVKRTSAFARLKEECKKHDKVVLIDFDAYDHRGLGMSWNDVINSDTKKMGHAFVLAMMIESKRY